MMCCTILLKSSEASADYKERDITIDFALPSLSEREKNEKFTFCLYLVALPDDSSINLYEIIVYF